MLAATAAQPAAAAPRPDSRVPGERVPAAAAAEVARTGPARRPDPVGLDAPSAVAAQKGAARREAPAGAADPDPDAAGAETEDPDASDTFVFGGLNAPGLARGAGGPSPPDTTGAIGTTRYVEVTNDDIAVYDRGNLGLVGSRLDLAAFAGFPAEFVVDPQIMWDSTSSRFYVVTTQRLYGTSGPGGTEAVQDFINVMWTAGSDPTDLSAGWCRFRFSTDSFGGAGEADDRYYFDDYPKLGDNASHLIIGVNVFEHDKANGRAYLGGARPFRGARIWTIRKPDVPSGSGCGSLGTPTAFGAPTDVTGNRYPDADAPGPNTYAFTPVPAIGVDDAATGYVVASDNALAARQDLNVWTVNGSGVVTLSGEVPVGGYAAPADVPQRTPGAGTLDALDGRLYQAFVTQDPDAGAPGLWTAHTIFGGAGAAVRAYEVLPATRVLRQTFNFTGASGLHLFNGVIAPGRNGRSAAVTFNTGGSSSNVDLRVRARQAGSALGAFEPSIVLGTSPTPPASATGCDAPPTPPLDSCRWGDYAGLSPDPLSSTVVWGSGQLQASTGNSDWTTRNFAVTSNSLPTLSVAASPTSAPTGTPITFTASATDPDPGGSIAAYALDLDGDGSFETPGPSGTRSFSVPGTYTVRAQATDNAGDVQVAASQVTIENRAPGVSLSATPAATAVNRPVTLAAGASDPDGSVAGFAFDLNGDNAFELNTGVAPTTTTRFTSVGSKTVRVRATDDRGAAGIGQATVLVRAFAVTGSVPSKQKLKTVRKKGLKAVARCPDGCKLRADLVVDGKSAKKLKINKKGKATVLGTATATLVAERSTTVTVKPSNKLGKRLKQIKGLKLSIKLSASDAFANRDAETLAVKLRTKK